jgi:hypothetical protein
MLELKKEIVSLLEDSGKLPVEVSREKWLEQEFWKMIMVQREKARAEEMIQHGKPIRCPMCNDQVDVEFKQRAGLTYTVSVTCHAWRGHVVTVNSHQER